MRTGHPAAKGKGPALVMGQVERMPILGRMKPFLTMNEATIATVETVDSTGAKRGAIAYGISHDSLDHGFVTYSTIEEAEAIVALLQAGIADAKRIEAGETPLAPISTEPPVRH